MKPINKIFLYSETFGKRISKLYDVSEVFDVCEKSDDSNLFDNIVNYLLKISNYKPYLNELIVYDFK